MNKIKNRILCVPLFVLTFIVVSAISVINLDAVYAAEETQVKFEEEYALPGEDLHVAVDGIEAEELTYKWFVDDIQISATSDSYCPTGDDLEKFISVEVWNGTEQVGECSLFCSKLPVVYINTNEGDVITKENYINADLRIQGNDKYNSHNTTLYDNTTELKGHGNSTWLRFDKKAYKLKLSKSTNLFGMGKSKHWLLIANYIDESCMRNMLSSYLGKEVGTTAMDAVWVDVVMNGECIGNYQLYEQVRVSEDRVDIFDWEEAAGDIAKAIAKDDGLSSSAEDALKDSLETDFSWMTTDEVEYNGKTYVISEHYTLPESKNGGFLMEMDSSYDEVSKFYTDRNAPIMIKNPEYINTNSTVFAGLQNYIQDFEDAIYSSDKSIKDGRNKKISYVDLCDADSLVSFWLASEFMCNEVGAKSTYMYKDVDGVLKFGPVWDFDWSADSVAPFGGTSAVKWVTKDRLWFSAAMQNPYFAVKARELYLKNEDVFRETASEGGTIDKWHDYIKESAINNENIWHYSRGFEEDVASVKSWITKRTNWMDDQFATDESSMKSLGVPLSDKLTLSLSSENLVQNSKKAYTIPVDSDKEYRLKVDINEGTYSKLNYYVNGRQIGSMNISGKNSAVVVIEQELLTEDLNEKNVISVWLEDAEGNLAEQQYCTLKISNGDNVYYNVVLNEYGASHAEKIAKGEKFRLPSPSVDTKDMLFMGWSSGNKVYSVASDMTITEDVTLDAVFATCEDGDVYHDWQKTEDGYQCADCHKDKADDQSYVDIASCSFTQSSRYNTQYTGNPVGPKITVSYQGRELVEGTDYEISYKNNVNAGYATYTVKGIKSAGFDGKAQLSYRIQKRNLSYVKMAISGTTFTYSGSAVSPYVSSATYNGKKLVKNKDYTVEYKNNKYVGTGSVVVTGKGNFTGTKEFKIKIVPKSTYLSSKPTAYRGKKVKVKWKKQSVQTSGYQIMYSRSSKFSNAKTVTVSGTSTTSKTIKMPTAKKTYYFKVRTYKTVDGVKYYSSWSKYKSVKTKR